jgi:polyhydroxyalkanoate synthesis regulator phasin
MDKLVKKGLEFGMGVAYITAGALKDAADIMEKKGKISHKQGEKMVQDTIKQYQAQSVKLAKDVRAQINGMMKKAPFASKKEMADLNAKIDKIIKQVSKASKSKK